MHYLADNSDPGLDNNWRAESFNDAAWSKGQFGIVYETGSGASVASNLLQTTVPNDTQSVYARTSFTITDESIIQNVFLGLDYDDGVIAWINGVELYRSATMPSGSPEWNTKLLSTHESSNGANRDSTPLLEITSAARPVLHNGTNVLIIGVWNARLSSSDLVLVPRLSMNEAEASVERGLYLQSGTSTSVVVKWRTTLATSSQVEFGSAPDNPVSAVKGTTPSTDHPGIRQADPIK
jgi:hypothetical protein